MYILCRRIHALPKNQEYKSLRQIFCHLYYVSFKDLLLICFHSNELEMLFDAITNILL